MTVRGTSGRDVGRKAAGETDEATIHDPSGETSRFPSPEGAFLCPPFAYDGAAGSGSLPRREGQGDAKESLMSIRKITVKRFGDGDEVYFEVHGDGEYLADAATLAEAVEVADEIASNAGIREFTVESSINDEE